MDKFGKYEVVERIAAGGFGEVFKGYDPMIKRSVAIKICSSDDQQMRRRFELEAEISGNLSHRNITTIYDYGVEDGTPYLVQELLDGEDLDRKIKRRQAISYSVKLGYMAHIAAGLEHSHAKGVVHRDLKPANIHILPDGTAKIMDYGIARLLNQDSDLTSDGQTIGTTAYLAPEQIRGEELDHRVDIFSFGTVSYELLTYERPYGGDTVSALMYQIISADPNSIRTYWPDCPADLLLLVESCMHKEPDRRPQDFSEIVGELSRMRESSASQELPVQTSSRTSSGFSSRASSGASPQPTDADDATQLMPTTSTGTQPNRRKRVGVAIGSIALAALGIAAWLGLRPGEESDPEAPPVARQARIAETASVAGEAAMETPAAPREAAAGAISEPPVAESTTAEASGAGGSPSGQEEASQQATSQAATSQLRTPVAPEKPVQPAVEIFELSSEPPGARIWVDGRRLTTPTSLELLPGASYRLRLEFEGHRSVDRILTLESLSANERSSRRVSIALPQQVQPERQSPAPPPVESPPSAAPVEETPPPSPAEDQAIALAAIRETLEDYEQAYKAFDVVALRRVWPSIDAGRQARLEENFSSLRSAGLSQTVDLDCPRPTLGSERATVSCRQIVVVTSGRREMSSAETEVEIDLEKIGGSWVIRSLQSR